MERKFLQNWQLAIGRADGLEIVLIDLNVSVADASGRATAQQFQLVVRKEDAETLSREFAAAVARLGQRAQH